MKNSLSEIPENTMEPISGLSKADLAVVHSIKFNALSGKFTVYLDKEKMMLVTSMFFYISGGIQLENRVTAPRPEKQLGSDEKSPAGSNKQRGKSEWRQSH